MNVVYLAGPTVFLPNAAEIFAIMKTILADCGLEGVAPLDNQIGLEQLESGERLAEAIYLADEELMRQADAAIFNIDPFRRGTEMDAGTAFEVGYCKALNLPMTAWTTDKRTYPEKVRDYMKSVFGEDLRSAEKSEEGGTSGTLRDPDAVLVHSEGMYQNLMIQIAIEQSGGLVYPNEDWTKAFDLAARHLSRLVAAKPVLSDRA
ncbi:MAG: nucleoside 2-deoxyribosyltransferase [Hyphomicrobiaceae bacterium]